MIKEKTRCEWCLLHPIYRDYHDREWGVPALEDQVQFEFLVLESAQAGLSWLTILKRRENYRLAYDYFDADKVASYGEDKIASLMQNEGIIRNRKKIEASVHNARLFLEIKEKYGNFSSYLWGFNNGQQKVNYFTELSQIPASSPLSDKISRDMKLRGFKFIGSTIIYAHLQATGLVNDHLTSCFRHQECMEG